MCVCSIANHQHQHNPKEIEEEEIEGPVLPQRRGRGRPKKKTKKSRGRPGSSKYLGVTRRERGGSVNFETKLHGIYMGTCALETDAALASDGLMRAIMRETGRVNMYSEKINFRTAEDYKKAREEEMITRDLEDDMESAVHKIAKKVDQALEKARAKGKLTT